MADGGFRKPQRLFLSKKTDVNITSVFLFQKRIAESGAGISRKIEKVVDIKFGDIIF